MITILASAVLAAGAPSNGIGYTLGDVDLASFKYIQTYTYCFEDAAIETREAPPELRTTRFEQCHAQRPAIIAEYKNDASPSAVRKLERSLNIIENAYAKGMGVPLPDTR